MSQAKGERRRELQAARKGIEALPSFAYFEIPGRPNVIFQVRDYRAVEDGAALCRHDAPFLFKAFETGQIGPKRLAKMSKGAPRVFTIHEYLDWTVTGLEAVNDGDLDFGGFRIIALLPRQRPLWTPPASAGREGPKAHAALGAPKLPLPPLVDQGKPICAAAIRLGPNYMEIPFFATHEGKRGKGYGRCLLAAIEQVARAVGINLLLLSSINTADVTGTWRHLGFVDTSAEQLAAFGVDNDDLMHMDNTQQMHKFVPPPARFKPLVIRHGHFSQRTYLPLDYRPSDSRPSASLARPSGGAPAYSQGAAYSHGAASSRLSTDSSASQMDASQYQECDEGDMDGDGDAAMDDAAATGQAQSAAPQQR